MDETRPIGRRTFLAIVAAGLSSLAWGDPAWRAIRSAFGPLELAGVPITPGGWRIFTVNPPMPLFDRERWRLRIDGLVENPISLTHDDLLALPSAHQVSDFHCVTGWSVYDVKWKGVRFADLLAAARPRREAGALSFHSAEKPYADSLTLEQAMDPEAMLAYEMDGKPLKRPHGAPARVVMPKMYGYKNVKWVERIEVTRTQLDGYWEERGYDRDAWVD